MDEIRVALFGCGTAGLKMMRSCLTKKGLRIVGAVDNSPDKIGKDLGTLVDGKELGVKITSDVKSVIAAKPDVLLHAATSFMKELYEQTRPFIEAGIDIVTIAEEPGGDPWAKNPDWSSKIDELAKKHKVSLLGTGSFPGYVDLAMLYATSICADVKSISVNRVRNSAFSGITDLKQMGIGTTPDEFRRGMENGSIMSHVGYDQTIPLVAKRIGLEIDEVKVVREPVIAEKYAEGLNIKVQPGQVGGYRGTAKAMKGDRVVIQIQHEFYVKPELYGKKVGTYVHAEGDPNFDVTLGEDIRGVAWYAVNRIPDVLNAPPGLILEADLPTPHAKLLPFSSYVKKK